MSHWPAIIYFQPGLYVDAFAEGFLEQCVDNVCRRLHLVCRVKGSKAVIWGMDRNGRVMHVVVEFWGMKRVGRIEKPVLRMNYVYEPDSTKWFPPDYSRHVSGAGKP